MIFDIMADSHANECSVNSDLNTLLNYSETKNLHEENNYPVRNDVLLSKSKLHLYWSGDLASLKHFVCNVIKLQGSWSQPGGDKKVFSGDAFSITWRKSKRMLKFDGERSNELKQLFCNELCGAQNPSQVGYEDERVNQSCESSSCKCLGLSTDMAGVQLDLVMMQRDIRMNNSDLAGLGDTINTLRSEIREVRQRLDKYDENVNLRSSVFTQTECLQVPPQLFSNHSQAICIDNSTQMTEIKPAKQQLCSSYIQTNCWTQTIDTDPIKLQHCLNQAQVNDNDNLTQTIDTESIDPQSNNRVIITRDIIPLVSETKDESIVEINGSNIKVVHNPCKDLKAVALSTDGRSYDKRYSILRNNVLQRPPPNNKQPIPVRITQRLQSKKNVREPFGKNKKRNNNQRNNVAMSHTKRQLGEGFRTQTRWRDRMKFYQYFY